MATGDAVDDRTAGDTSASLARRLTRLHRTHYAPMVRGWTARCGSREDAEDLVQDAFAKVYRRYRGGVMPTGFDDDAVLLRVLHVTTRNLLIDGYRRASALRRHGEQAGFEAEIGLPHGVPTGLAALAPIGWDHPVEDEIAVRELLDRLLDQLDPHWARVLALLCDDFSPAEIGSAMDGRNGHVLVRRAREHICRLLAGLAAAGDRAAAWMGLRFCGWPAAPAAPK